MPVICVKILNLVNIHWKSKPHSRTISVDKTSKIVYELEKTEKSLDLWGAEGLLSICLVLVERAAIQP